MKFFFYLPTRGFSKYMSLFTIGILIGAVMATLAIGQQVEKVKRENSTLEVQLAEKEEQIKALEDKVSEAKKWFIIKEIAIELELPQRNFAAEEELTLKISEQIKEMLQDIRGKRVNEVDPQVIWQIVEGRKVEALGYQFSLQVKGIILSEKLVFYVSAQYIPAILQQEPALAH